MKIIATLVLSLTLVVSMTTFASAQTVDGYTNQAGAIQTQAQGGSEGTAPAATATDTGGSLPFTGLDLALLALAGGALVIVGLGMRTLTRAPETR